MEKSLVSIVTPCYNTGAYIHRLLDSVLEQTYPNIEMFVIDDGSTDNSADVVSSYMERFKARGYSLTLVKQENQGQSVAINRGLQLIKGKYFVWPDSDDYYASSDAIERMVAVFEKSNNDYGLVRTQENLLEDETLKVIGHNGINAEPECDKRKLFEDCLFCKNGFFFCPGAYMADYEKIKACMPLSIYTQKDAGQNWQLMLPLLYNYKCYTIQEPLYNVVVRLSSHSRGQYKGFTEIIKKYDAYENTIVETLKRIKGMPKQNLDKYLLEIKRKYCKERLQQAFKYREKTAFNQYYSELLKVQGVTKSVRAFKVLFAFPFIVKCAMFIRRKLAR